MASRRKRTPRASYYPGRYSAAQTAGTDDFSRGWKIGQTLGGGIADLAKTIKAAQAQAIQDRVANRLMNALPGPGGAPRAAWVGGVVPKAGISLAGTAPATGGTAELETRIKAQQLSSAIAREQAAATLARGRAARPGTTVGVGSGSAWAKQARGAGNWGGRGGGRGGGGGGGAGGTTKQSKQTEKERAAAAQAANVNQPQAYNMNTARAEFDEHYGKGSYDKLTPYMQNIQPAGSDTSTLTGMAFDKNGNLGYYEEGKLKTMIPGSDAPIWQGKINTARANTGFAPVGPPPSVINPDARNTGTADNPYTPKNQWEVANVPENGYYVDPDIGNIGQRLSAQNAVYAAQARAASSLAAPGEDYSTTYRKAQQGFGDLADLSRNPSAIPGETAGALETTPGAIRKTEMPGNVAPGALPSQGLPYESVTGRDAYLAGLNNPDLAAAQESYGASAAATPSPAPSTAPVFEPTTNEVLPPVTSPGGINISDMDWLSRMKPNF
jgi:hypothetical protein